MNFDINVYCMTALLLIKPCNISPRLLFVPARQLMSPTLSQRETKAQRTHCTLKSLRPRVQRVRRKLCFQNDAPSLTPWDQPSSSSYPPVFNTNKALCFIHLSSSFSCRSVGQSCCHHEHQEKDLDKLYHNQLTKWSTFSGQMRHSSPAAAVIHHTPGDKCWITTHPVWKGKET